MPPLNVSALVNEGRGLLTIAWPMFIAQLAQMGTGVVDTIMAGHYSATDLATIAISAFATACPSPCGWPLQSA
jgi:Na+-driven multidrug efflux pump